MGLGDLLGAVAVRVDTEFTPSITLGLQSQGGGGDGGLKGLVMKVLKPRIAVLVNGTEATNVAPGGDPNPGRGFPLLIAASLLGPLAVFSVGWWAGHRWASRKR
jgi:hypothetical protein